MLLVMYAVVNIQFLRKPKKQAVILALTSVATPQAMFNRPLPANGKIPIPTQRTKRRGTTPEGVANAEAPIFGMMPRLTAATTAGRFGPNKSQHTKGTHMRKLIQRFWLWLARLAYQQACKNDPSNKIPDGIPGIRDHKAHCTGYEPRKPQPLDWRTCAGDGHYLCGECCHRDPRSIQPIQPEFVELADVESHSRGNQ